MFSEREILLWLSGVPSMNVYRARDLLRRLGTLQNVFGAKAADIAHIAHLGDSAARALEQEDREETLNNILDNVRFSGIKYVVITDTDFPERLRHTDTPLALYYKGLGDLNPLSGDVIAVVGTRRPSEYAIDVADHIGRECARYGIVVVSGLAEGCDAAAHKGVLSADGLTAAVLGCGVDVCYPAVNRPLYEDLVEKGIILSEYPPGTRPNKWRFPARNRIISGLSEAVCVVEAGKKSGALITAQLAIDRNRAVFAVPGNIFSPDSFGTSDLIRNGATPFLAFSDVCRSLNIDVRSKPNTLPVNLNKTERLVFDNINDDPLTIEDIRQIMEDSNVEFATSDVALAVTRLELYGYIRKTTGARYRRVR